MNTRSAILTIVITCFCAHALAQDLTGTWEGALWGGNLSMYDRTPRIVTGTGLSQQLESVQGGAVHGLQRQSTMVWELVQSGRKVYGIVYFFSPEASNLGKPNACFTWMGKMAADTLVPFSFIQGKSLEGLMDLPYVQFNVHKLDQQGTMLLHGNVYRTIESLQTQEKNSGNFTMRKVSNVVQSRYWSQWKQASIKEKLNICWVHPD